MCVFVISLELLQFFFWPTNNLYDILKVNNINRKKTGISELNKNKKKNQDRDWNLNGKKVKLSNII